MLPTRGLPLGRRLAIGFGALLSLTTALIALSLFQLGEAAKVQEHVLTVTLPRSEVAAELLRALHQQDVTARRYAKQRSVTSHEEHADAVAAVHEALSRLQDFPPPRLGRNVLADLTALSRVHAERSDALMSLAGSDASEPTVAGAEARLAQIHGDLSDLAEEFAGLQAERAEDARAELGTRHAQIIQNLLAMGLLVLLVGGVTAVYMTRRIREPLHELVEATRAIASDDFGPSLALADRLGVADVDRPVRVPTGGDEIRELSGAFGRTAALLVARQRRLETDARIASALALNVQPADLAAAALREICAHVDCQLGAVYLLDRGTERLERIAGFAAEGTPDTFAVGEGIPGQAAADRKPVVVEDLPANAPFTLRLGPEDLPPRTVLALPMLIRDHLMGAVLLGSVHTLSPSAQTYAEEALPSLAISLRDALAQEEVQRLVEALESRNEEVQAQNEELQSQREEILAQNEELVAQSEEIQAHNEFLSEADRRKNGFLAMLGHELRNPLAAIVHASALLEARQVDDAAALRFQEIISRQTRLLVRLVDDLLDLARVDNGKLSLDLEPVSVQDAIERAVDGQRAPLDEKGHHLEVVLPERPVVLEADPVRLQQIVANLIHNAVKYTPQGGHIRVSATADDAEAVIRVQDDGIGLEADALERIFQPFDQAHSNHSEAGGLGLGLTLVRKLTELHGGRVRAGSDGRGRGSEFILHLPRRTAGAEDGARVDPALEAASELSMKGRDDREATPETELPVGLRVLIVDDDEDGAITLAELVAGWGHRVKVVHDGREALGAALDHRPHLAIVDINLPGMDGYEVARRLRDQPSLARTYLAAATGFGQSDARERSERAGFDVHLTKPVLPERLESLLRTATPQRDTASAAG